MEEMTRKQPDVDKITKTHKRKAALEPANQSQIPVLGKGRAGSMYPTNTPRRAWPEPSGPVMSHCRMTRHPPLVHFNTWNDVTTNLFYLIAWWRCLSFTHRKTFSHTNHVRISNTSAHWNQEPPGQPAGHEVAARVAAGFGQKEETQWCHGQTRGGNQTQSCSRYSPANLPSSGCSYQPLYF